MPPALEPCPYVEQNRKRHVNPAVEGWAPRLDREMGDSCCRPAALLLGYERCFRLVSRPQPDHHTADFCFRDQNCHLLAWGTMLASRHTAPATTGEATLVPDRDLQPPWILLPITSRP